MYTLIVLTFLAGNAWGPQVQVTPMPTAQACEAARSATSSSLVKMSKTNMTGGGATEEKDGEEIVLVAPSGREIARLICQSNQVSAKLTKASKMAADEDLPKPAQPQKKPA